VTAKETAQLRRAPERIGDQFAALQAEGGLDNPVAHRDEMRPVVRRPRFELGQPLEDGRVVGSGQPQSDLASPSGGAVTVGRRA
jgi:hypothetical protein